MKVEFSGHMTACHRKLHNILADMGFQVTDNYSVGKYEIDCYCEDINLGFEADGTPFHKWKSKDRRRDKEIFISSGIKIFRLSDKELNKTEEAKNKVEEFVKNNAR